MSYNIVGIAIEESNANSQISVGLGGQNTLTCINPFVCDSGIYMDNINESERVLVQFNVINGLNVLGINLNNINTKNYFIADNTINDALIGLNAHNNMASGISRIRQNIITNSSSGQVSFSPNGELYAVANGQYLHKIGGERGTVLRVFNFDRCNGELVEIGTDIGRQWK